MNLEIEIVASPSGREYELARLILKFWESQPPDDLRSRFGTVHPPCEAVFASLIKNFAVLCLAYVVTDSGKTLVGHAEAGRMKDQVNWVEISVATDSEYRHLGIARRLLESTVLTCKAKGIVGIKAYVLPYNADAMTLAHRLSERFPISCKYLHAGYMEYTYFFDIS